MTSPFVSQDLYLNNIGLDGSIVPSGGGSSSTPLSGGTVIHVTGTNYTYQTANNGDTIRRTNGGVAMFDTLPQAKTAIYYPNGFVVWVENSDATANLTITPTTSTINGLTTLVLAPGATTRIVSDGTNYYAFITSSSTAGVVAGNNISITPVGGNSQISFANPLDFNGYGVISAATPSAPITMGNIATKFGDTQWSFTGPGATPTDGSAAAGSHIYYNFNMPGIGASSALCQENGVCVSTMVPLTGAAFSYEKNAILAQIVTSDSSPTPSSVYRDSVAIAAQGIISSTTSFGRAWGGGFYGIINSGGDGQLTGIEIDMQNAGTDVQPDQLSNKVCLNLVNIGSVNCSVAIEIDKSSTGGWHKGIYSNPSAYATGDTGASAFELATASSASGTTTIMRIDPTGYIGIGTMGIGQTFLNAPVPIAVTTHVASYRGASNVSASFAYDSANAGVVLGTTAGGNAYICSSLTSGSAGVPLDLQTGGGLVLRLGYIASPVNYLQVYGSTTGSPIQIQTVGTDTNIGLTFETQGAGNIALAPNNTAALIAVPVSGSVNYTQVLPGLTGNPSVIRSVGSDTNVGLNLQTKGTGTIQLAPGNLNGLTINGVASSVNYVQVTPAITGSGPVITSAGSDTNVGLFINTQGSGSIYFQPNGLGVLGLVPIASSVNYWQMFPESTGLSPVLRTVGSDTNVGMLLSTQGTGSVFLSPGTSSATTLQVSPLAGSVNYWQMFPETTGVSPVLKTIGSDTNIGMIFQTKGTGTMQFNPGGSVGLFVQGIASSVNYLNVVPAATTNAVQIQALGTDTNVGLTIETQGTGNIVLAPGNLTGFEVQATASAVNGLIAIPNATGGRVAVGSFGSDTNINLAIITKGIGNIVLTPGGGLPGLIVSGVTSAVNSFTIAPSTTGLAPSFVATGSDTNIGIILQPKGTGAINFVASALSSNASTPATQAFGPVTANGFCGYLTFTVTTAGATSATAVITNIYATASSTVYVSIRSYSGTYFTNGNPQVASTGQTSGAWTLVLNNLHATNALSGTLQISFLVIN